MDWFLDQLRLKGQSELIAKAPLPFLVFIAFGFLVGYGMASWYLSGRLAERDGLIARYRVALGIDKASQGALIELTNAEMRAKAVAMAAALREFNIGLRRSSESAVAGAKDEKDKAERSFRVLAEKSNEFDRTLKAEANLVDNELRRRLGPKAVASIVGVPPSVFSTDDRAAVSIMGLMPSGTQMSAGFAATLADAIEQMALLLPDK